MITQFQLIFFLMQSQLKPIVKSPLTHYLYDGATHYNSSSYELNYAMYVYLSIFWYKLARYIFCGVGGVSICAYMYGKVIIFSEVRSIYQLLLFYLLSFFFFYTFSVTLRKKKDSFILRQTIKKNILSSK